MKPLTNVLEGNLLMTNTVGYQQILSTDTEIKKEWSIQDQLVVMSLTNLLEENLLMGNTVLSHATKDRASFKEDVFRFISFYR